MNFNKLLFLVLSVFVLTNCTSDDTADIIINVNGDGSTGNDDVQNISGVYTEDLTLDANTEYVINGPLLMSSGTTLTIPAGTTLTALPVGVNAYIAIQQGARIDAQGTMILGQFLI